MRALGIKNNKVLSVRSQRPSRGPALGRHPSVALSLDKLELCWNPQRNAGGGTHIHPPLLLFLKSGRNKIPDPSTRENGGDQRAQTKNAPFQKGAAGQVCFREWVIH